MVDVDGLRHDWAVAEVAAIYRLPLMDLVYRAATVHRAHHEPGRIQVCKLISIKTGGCPEDCAYCSQSAHYESGVGATPLLGVEEVVALARQAQEQGASRVCLGAAWREVKEGPAFDQVVETVRRVSDLGVEVCCTLGMLNEGQARRLEDAGLRAYNHNLDTSEAHYERVITTRTYADRLRTIGAVRQTGVTLCCGGILGLGESEEDRIELLRTLANLNPHPESVPINLLARVPGTPLADGIAVPVVQAVRMIATARILMPSSVVRLSAGRAGLSVAEQALCFLAGANSIFSSETGTMLTEAVPTPDFDADVSMFGALGLRRAEAADCVR